jgi:hypothetical protein
LYNQEEFVSILISKLGDYGIAEIIMQKKCRKKYFPNESNQIKRRGNNEISLKKRYSPLTHVSFVYIFSFKTIDFIKGSTKSWQFYARAF